MKLKLVAVCLTIGMLAFAGWASPTGASGDQVDPVDQGVVDQAPVDRTGPVRSSVPVDPEPVLLSGPGSTITALDPVTHQVSYRMSDAQFSPTHSRIYSSSKSWISIRNTVTGERLGRVKRPAEMELQVASTSGEFLAFALPAAPGSNEWMPAGRSRTKIMVVSTRNEDLVRTYDLKGNFAVEAFATNDRELFLIEYLPARAPWHYGLRRLILSNGEIRQIERENQGAPEEMDGTGKLAVFSPGGHELYTLYTQQDVKYAHVPPADANRDEVYAFVHLLNLNGGWTHCIDLPAPFGTGAATTHAMAVSDDGSALYVADPSSGGLALIDPVTSLVKKSVTFDLDHLKQGIAAAVGADGTLYLAGRSKIFAFDGTTLSLQRTWNVRTGRPNIAVNPDGTELFVQRAKDLIVLNATH